MFHVEHPEFLILESSPWQSGALSQKCSTWNIAFFCRGQAAVTDVPRGTSHVFVQGDCAGRMFHVEHPEFLILEASPWQSGALSQKCSTWNIGAFCPGEVAGSDVPRGTSGFFVAGRQL
jgi:hypothetical protein